LSFVKQREQPIADEMFLDEVVKEVESDKSVYKQVLVVALRLIKHSLNRKPQPSGNKTIRNLEAD
jgi:hypothetical protein